jgi:hypothetical protein
MKGALEGIKWKSADRDNMEFSATITCFQMDKIRALLSTSAADKIAEAHPNPSEKE